MSRNTRSRTLADRFAAELDAIEALTFNGSVPQARAKLVSLLADPLPREHVARAARLVAVTGDYQRAIRMLNPVVRPQDPRVSPPSDSETAEYANALSQIGFGREALGLLESLNKDGYPPSHFYEAMALMAEWRYAEAIEPLKRYLKHCERGAVGIGPTGIPRAKMHLGRAALYGLGDHTLAQKHLDEVLAMGGPTRFRYHYGFSLLYSAINAVDARDFGRARQIMERALPLRQDGDYLFNLYAEAWNAFARLPLDGQQSSLAEIHRVRDQFYSRGVWDFVRDLDFHKAEVLEDRRLLTHLYFGTPLDGLRAEIARRMGGASRLPETYQWHLPRASSHAAKINASDGTHNLGRGFLKEGQALHRLFRTLASDFYLPVRLASLHESVYPDEYYNPVSSPDKVRKAVERLRAWFESEGIPLGVNGGVNEGCALESAKGCSILVAKRELGKVELKPAASVRTREFADKLRTMFGDSRFSSPEAAAGLAISERSALRRLAEAASAGLIVSIGAGPARRYVIAVEDTREESHAA